MFSFLIKFNGRFSLSISFDWNVALLVYTHPLFHLFWIFFWLITLLLLFPIAIELCVCVWLYRKGAEYPPPFSLFLFIYENVVRIGKTSIFFVDLFDGAKVEWPPWSKGSCWWMRKQRHRLPLSSSSIWSSCCCCCFFSSSLFGCDFVVPINY